MIPRISPLRIHNRKVHRVILHNGIEDVADPSSSVTGRNGAMQAVKLHIQVKPDLRPLGQVEVDVILKCVLHIVNVIVEREEILAAPSKHTALVYTVHIHEVGNLTRTTPHIKIRFLIKRGGIKQFFIPINIRIQIRIESLQSPLHFLP